MALSRRLPLVPVCLLVLLCSSAAVQAQPARGLPSDAELILTINIQQLLKSEAARANQVVINLAKGAVQDQLNAQGIGKHFKTANFDLFRDLSSITVAVPGGRDPEESMVLLEGSFDPEKIESTIIEATKDVGGVKVIRIAGVKAVAIPSPNEKAIFIGVLDKNTLIATSTRKDFEEAVMRMKSDSKPVPFKAAIVGKLVSTVNEKQSISLVATGRTLAELSRKAPRADANEVQQVLGLLKNIDGFSAAFTLEKDIKLQVGINVQDEDTAMKYAAIATLALGFAKAKLNEEVKKNENLAPAVEIVNAIRVSSVESNLVIRGQITFANLQKILENLPTPK